MYNEILEALETYIEYALTVTQSANMGRKNDDYVGVAGSMARAKVNIQHALKLVANAKENCE